MKKTIKAISILLALLTCCTVFLVSCDSGSTPSGSVPTTPGTEDESTNALQEKYDNAVALIGEGKYEEAYALFEELGDFNNANTELAKFRYVPTKMTYTEIEIEDGDKEIHTSSAILHYDEHNFPLQITFTNGDENYIYDYDYDDKGNLLKEIYTDYDGSKSITDYTYDTNGNCIKEVYTYSDGDKYIYDYTYDTNGNLIKEVYTRDDGAKEVSDYTYDTNGNLIKEIYTDYDGDKSIYDYTYDDHGNLIKEAYSEVEFDYEYSLTLETEYKLVYIPVELSEEQFEEMYGVDW